MRPRVQRMAHRLKTPEGRALCALRKQLPEPRVRHHQARHAVQAFLLHGLEKTTGEWKLVVLAYNLRRLHGRTTAVDATDGAARRQEGSAPPARHRTPSGTRVTSCIT